MKSLSDYTLIIISFLNNDKKYRLVVRDFNALKLTSIAINFLSPVWRQLLCHLHNWIEETAPQACLSPFMLGDTFVTKTTYAEAEQ